MTTAWWMNSRRLAAQCADGGDVERHVGEVIVAADDVGDAEVEVVHRARPVVGGAAVGAQDHERRHAPRAQLEAPSRMPGRIARVAASR